MEKKNLLIVGILTGIIIVLIGIGPIIFPNSTSADDSISAGNLHDLNSSAKNITDGLNSVNESSTNETFPEDFSKDYTTFDNSTSKLIAISIARLYQGLSGFYTSHTFNTSLTPDKKYWIVKMDDLMVVTVDAKTLMSKQNGDLNPPVNTWQSLDALKAQYTADIQSTGDETVGESHKITLNGKNIWKVPIYTIVSSWQGGYDDQLVGYVYVDLATGKSKKLYSDIFYDIYCYIFNDDPGTDGWLTLKEVDEKSGWWPSPFRDALRDLYLE
ncbi:MULTISPECIES: hypothetical protein [Methanobacterium]|jgi:hypothetical protein|uniref:Uncharacterized protein n=1 Tax=Methanobacterium veterum TaxID=408577 RepID=A0A9E5A287_9EURY|nr:MULTISPECIES: hypothetical protein [Methanobacterium]MCZ3365811.1 hypothetical protein [Methanobacterium veterum]MCZ3371276.1 hypothetical protein [Methanobacterium veterum]